MTNTDSNAKFARALKRSASYHRKGEFEKILIDFENFDGLLDVSSPLRGVPLNFWDGWVDEINHGFVGHYKSIAQADWPRLAELIAADLEMGKPITEPVILSNFKLDQPEGRKKGSWLLLSGILFFVIMALANIVFE